MSMKVIGDFNVFLHKTVDGNWNEYYIEMKEKATATVTAKMKLLSCNLVEFDNHVEVLKEKEVASIVADLFESDCSLKEENEVFLYSHYGTDILLFDKIYVLESVEIADEFDLQSTLYLFFTEVFSELEIDKEECAFFIGTIKENRKNKEKNNLLCNEFIFQNLGFLKITQEGNSSLLIHNTALGLRETQKK